MSLQKFQSLWTKVTGNVFSELTWRALLLWSLDCAAYLAGKQRVSDE